MAEIEDVAETVRRAHEANQRNWKIDVESLPEFAGKDRATERREALIEALDKMDTQRRARDLAAAEARAAAQAAEQRAALAARKAELEAELAAISNQLEPPKAVKVEPVAAKPTKKE